ncbi:catabolite control protein A [Fructilactobacillus fructivorans]|uniref:catabolite control protein A n=1 Tax=Fructilactobacillus fructivorans TaxID=1614 RepID=UPI000704BE28|nr:catabolite control protein A [Fructilactobacillus fructivorans]KRN40753.1 catabolite control protein A [Fructilactobacillus fructivorans]KRN42433.1 catabolite control protein A [Fructilactobacillus fructivorans]
MKKQNVTIYDVAREANVSMATVSRVVNGNQNVKDATKQKVLNIIDKLDYRPNAVARGLASKKSTTVGVIIPNVTNTYFASLARGIDDIATMYKRNIILTNSDGNNQRELTSMNTLQAKQVDGIIFMGNEISEELRSEFKKSRAPVVLAGSVDASGKIPSVNIDYRQAVYSEVTNLINNGNDRIAFVSGPLERSINKDFRLKGYKDALTDAGIPYEKSLLFETDVSYSGGYALRERLQKNEVTAAIVTDDDMAAGVMNSMTDDGISVPGEFELATSNDTKLTEMTRPTMSTITQPLYDVGAVAMRLLMKLMNNEDIEENKVFLPFGLKKRESTK